MKTRRTFLLIIMFSLVVLLSGCNLSSIKVGEVRIGMFGETEDGHMVYSYGTFTGLERMNVQAETGQTLSVEYEAAVSKGSLLIEWQDPNGEVIAQRTLQSDDQGGYDIAVKTSGNHTILVQGKNTGGKFDLSWETK